MTSFLKEVSSYLACIALLAASYFVGNLIISLTWGVTSSYDHWRGPIIALIQTAGQIIVYVAVASRFPFAKARHVAIPPIMAATVSLTVIGLNIFLTGFQLPVRFEGWFIVTSWAINTLGWGGYGFVRLADPDGE